MTDIKDSNDTMIVGTLIASLFLGAAAVAMMDSRDDDSQPEPPAQVEVQKGRAAQQQNPEANHPVPDTIRLP